EEANGRRRAFARRQTSAVPTERQPVNPAFPSAFDAQDLLERLRIPHLQEAEGIPRRHEPAVRAPGEAQALPGALEGRQVLAAGRLPEAQLAPAIQAGEPLAVGAVGQAPDK